MNARAQLPAIAEHRPPQIVQAVGIFGSPDKFEHAQRVAKVFSESALVPGHFQGKLANCLIALNIADRMGEDPLTVMQNLAIVSGKPCWQTQYMIARANKSGVFASRITWAAEGKAEALAVTASAKLADSGEVVSVAVSMAMAKADGWLKNAKYQSMPEHMLRWRSAAMLIRLYAPEVMLGIQSVEEVEDVSSGAARDVTPPRPAQQPVIGASPTSAARPSGPPRIAHAPPAKPEAAPEPEKTEPSADEEAEACVAQFEQDAQHAQTEQDLEECAAIVVPLEEGNRLSRAQRNRIESAMEAASQRIAASAPQVQQPAETEAEDAEEVQPEVDPNDPDFKRGIADRQAGQKRCVIAAIRENPDRFGRWKAGYDSLDGDA